MKGVRKGLWVGVVLGCAVALLASVFDADAATIRVRCELRDDRSKISVDGNDLAENADFTATVTSGASGPVSADMNTNADGAADEVEFDFDSDPEDIAEGATGIGADFIAPGDPPQVTGTLTGPGVNLTEVADCKD